MIGMYRCAASTCNSPPRLEMSRRGKKMLMQAREICFDDRLPRRPHCAAATPIEMVRRAEMDAWMAPRKGISNPGGT